ncbi:MAG: VWA domain-containing protein [Alphaproteobacteria bacterium]
MSFLYFDLWVLVFLPLIIQHILPQKKESLGASLRIPFLKDLQSLGSGQGGVKSGSSKFFYMFIIWAFLVLALMRPVIKSEPIKINSESRNVVMIMDISPSMQERDFVYNARRQDRLTGVKNIASQFIKNRTGDKVGLVLFATRAYLQSPITYDTKSVIDILSKTEAGMAGESTAIGDALGLGLKYLKDEPDKDKKVMILLTDGESNDGFISVAQATQMAQEEGVKIYTIGVGNQENFMNSIFGSQGFDEKSLKQIADLTKGRYFKASSANELARAYQEIDKLEPIDNEDKILVLTKEMFYIPALMALVLSVLFMVLYQRRNS